MLSLKKAHPDERLRTESDALFFVAPPGKGARYNSVRELPSDVATLSVHCASGDILLDVFPDLGDHDGAFAHRRGHPLYRPRPHVADSKNARVGSRKRRSRWAEAGDDESFVVELHQTR